jgi:hypothetical protein
MSTSKTHSRRLAALDQWSKDSTAYCVETFGVAPGRWLQMEQEHGTLGACKRVLTPASEAQWVRILTPLYETNGLKWSVEAAALKPEFAPLFTDDERAVARDRLQQFGYDPATD